MWAENSSCYKNAASIYTCHGVEPCYSALHPWTVSDGPQHWSHAQTHTSSAQAIFKHLELKDRDADETEPNVTCLNQDTLHRERDMAAKSRPRTTS